MYSPHLGSDSEKPAEVEGQARLYAMKFCPFSHRIRLILSLKKIPYDVVNINVFNKPEWYLQLNPEGKVPTFVDADGKVVTDSVAIANYLDEKYPDPPLYNNAMKAYDLELLELYSKITTVFHKCIRTTITANDIRVHRNEDANRSLDEVIGILSEVLIEYENDLESRGTIYFGGDQPGMLDILMWPWVELGRCLPLVYKQPVRFRKEKFPCMMRWIASMKAQGFVQENACTSDDLIQLTNYGGAGSVDHGEQ